MNNRVIGVDAGATQTVAAVASQDGQILAEVALGGANPLLSGTDAFGTVVNACRDALAVAQCRWDEVASVFIGMSGVDEPDSPSHKSAMRSLKGLIPVPFDLDNDALVAHWGAFAGDDGVLTIAGTGAITLALCRGRRYRVDGMGEWLGDEGSATWISLEALRAAVRSRDGRGPSTRLADRLPRALGVGSLRDVVSLLSIGEVSKQELAWLAQQVKRAADEGDGVAQSILVKAGHRLSRSALAAIGRCRRRLPVSYAGGVFSNFPAVLETFRSLLVERGLEVREPLAPPHLGACLLAAQRASWNVDQDWLRRLATARQEEPPVEEDKSLLAVIPRLISEQRNEATEDISRRTIQDILTAINDEDQTVPVAVRAEIPAIGQVVRWAVDSIRRGGRIFYVGAGTSGRLGVMDAAECPPTFGTPPEWFQGIMAGGYEALYRSVEGAEDDRDAGRKASEAARVGERDLVIGISMSGRTPFVIGAAEEAKRRGARTVALTVNRLSPLTTVCDLTICPAVGPEVVAGSTRMKAGTATKLILNMISTTAMVRLGRVERNLMISVKTWSGKLRERAKRIVALMGGVSLEQAEELLSQSGWDIRKALARLSGSQETEAPKG